MRPALRHLRRSQTRQWRAFRPGFAAAIGDGPSEADQEADDEADDLAAVCFSVLERTRSVDAAVEATVRRCGDDWELVMSPRLVERLREFLVAWLEAAAQTELRGMSRRALMRSTVAALDAVRVAFGSPADASDAEFDAAVDADTLLSSIHGALHRSGMGTSGLLYGKDDARALLRRDDLRPDQRAAVTRLLSILDQW